jgi:hypothetical protein
MGREIKDDTSSESLSFFDDFEDEDLEWQLIYPALFKFKLVRILRVFSHQNKKKQER